MRAVLSACVSGAADSREWAGSFTAAASRELYHGRVRGFGCIDMVCSLRWRPAGLFLVLFVSEIGVPHPRIGACSRVTHPRLVPKRESRASQWPDAALQYRARQFQAEIKWLGIRSTPACEGEPECNGVAERFVRTLKEECIHLHYFETLEEARAVIATFVEHYNNGWLLQRHGYMTRPVPARSSAEGRPDVHAVHLSRKPGPVHLHQQRGHRAGLGDPAAGLHRRQHGRHVRDRCPGGRLQQSGDACQPAAGARPRGS